MKNPGLFRLPFYGVLGIGLFTACPDNTPIDTDDTEPETSSSSSSGDSDPTNNPSTPPTSDTTDPTITTGPTTDPTLTTDPDTTDPDTTDPSTSTGPDPSTDTTATTTPDTDTSTSTPDTDTDTSTGGPLTLCEKLGGEPGIGELITTAFGIILVDDKVNGYFLNNDVDATNLGTCLIKQVGEAVGCPGVVYDCLDMVTAHAGLGISANDFTDFAVDFSAALDAHQMVHPELEDADKSAIIDVLAAMAPDIVEDSTNDATVYQRVGRKPAVRALIGKPGEADSFVDNVANNPAINGFFGATDFDRLNTCLTRQVSGIDGPTKYGLEVDAPDPADPGVAPGTECKDMETVHTGLVDANDNIGIDINDFLALVTDLVTAMNTFAVPQPDQDAILAVLGPMCDVILAPQFRNDCPGAKKDETVEKLAVAIPIPDDVYDGSIGSMGCVDLDVADDGINFVLGLEAVIGADHTWVGDVTMKIQSPAGKVLTVMSRPGLNEAVDGQGQCCGDSSNLGKAFPMTFKNMGTNMAEAAGMAIASSNGIICMAEAPPLMNCTWNPNPGMGPGTNFTDFLGEPTVGTWKVCVGDGSGGDTGTIDQAKLIFNKGKHDPTP